MNLFIWGGLATILSGLVSALVFTNLDVIESVKSSKEEQVCKKSCS